MRGKKAFRASGYIHHVAGYNDTLNQTLLMTPALQSDVKDFTSLIGNHATALNTGGQPDYIDLLPRPIRCSPVNQTIRRRCRKV